MFQRVVKALEKKEAALHVELSNVKLENIDLKREVTSAWQASDPNIIQLKQLMLDPAVNREFQRLKGDLDEALKQQQHLKEELEAVTFTQESKTGKALLQKVRSLQEENEEMGRELSRGKVHQLEAQLNAARDFAHEVHKNFAELEEHCGILDEENQELQMQTFAFRRQVRDLENQLRFNAQFDRRPEFPFKRDMGGRGMLERKRPFPDKERGGERDADRSMMPGFMGRKRI